jgi:hypothetical protein
MPEVLYYKTGKVQLPRCSMACCIRLKGNAENWEALCAYVHACVRACVPGDVSNRLPDVIRWMKGGGSVRTNNKRGREVTREHS